MKQRYAPILLASLITIAGFFAWYWFQSNPNSAQASINKFRENLLVSPVCRYGIEIDSLAIEEAVFQPNENLSDILVQYNVSQAAIHRIAIMPDEQFDVRKLRANKPYTVVHDRDSLRTIHSFVYHPNPIDYVTLHFDGDDSVWVERGHNPVDTTEHELSGVIESSLYNSVVDAGGTPLLVNELSEVYAWVIDFFGLQKGDQYRLIYTTYEVDGEYAGFGEIRAASFTHMDQALFAFSYDQGEGPEYFDECGQSLRKTFLKAPLRYSRISSHFSYSRLHPILKIRRPHLGVDYAAPRGTPVVAIGDGVVEKAAYSGGAGRMVRIKHNSNYATAYLHLWKYGPGIKPGVSVKQGQVIGYVGSTGLSTGPHLDFRFYQNGRPIDPLKVNPGSSEPIQADKEEPYMIHMAQWKQRLEQLSVPQVAPVLASTPIP